MQVRLTFSFLVLPAGQLSMSHAITSNTNTVMLAHEHIKKIAEKIIKTHNFMFANIDVFIHSLID